MNSHRNTADVIRGLECLLEPDPTGNRCYDCAYACEGEATEKRILRDAVLMLEWKAEKNLRKKADNGKH